MLRGYPTNIKLSLPGMHINDIESCLRDSYMIPCTGNWPAGKLTATLVVALLMFNGCGRVNSRMSGFSCRFAIMQNCAI